MTSSWCHPFLPLEVGDPVRMRGCKLRLIAGGRKCKDKNFITIRNYMKMRDLTFRIFGRKCKEKTKILFAFQEFLLSLQPNN